MEVKRQRRPLLGALGERGKDRTSTEMAQWSMAWCFSTRKGWGNGRVCYCWQCVDCELQVAGKWAKKLFICALRKAVRTVGVECRIQGKKVTRMDISTTQYYYFWACKFDIFGKLVRAGKHIFMLPLKKYILKNYHIKGWETIHDFTSNNNLNTLCVIIYMQINGMYINFIIYSLFVINLKHFWLTNTLFTLFSLIHVLKSKATLIFKHSIIWPYILDFFKLNGFLLYRFNL